jgi:hypothetical protein
VVIGAIGFPGNRVAAADERFEGAADRGRARLDRALRRLRCPGLRCLGLRCLGLRCLGLR